MFCHQCGYNLTLGNEKYCPSCGTKLGQSEESISGKNDSSIRVADTEGDVIGVGVSGSSNIIGREIGGYTLNGNVVHLHFSESISKEVITDTLQKIVSVQTQISQPQLSSTSNAIHHNNMLKESVDTERQIKSILEEVNKIEKKEGTQIHQIMAGQMQISQTELLVKQAIIEGNEYFYQNRYDDAIKCYDKAIGFDQINSSAWNNKGLSFGKVGKYNEALACFEKAIEIKPFDAKAISYKREILLKMGRHVEAAKANEAEITASVDFISIRALAYVSNRSERDKHLKEFDKAIETEPFSIAPLIKKAIFLDAIGNSNEARTYFDKAIEIDPNSDFVWHAKGWFLEQLGDKGSSMYEAVKCYDKAIEIDPNFFDHWYRKGEVLRKMGSLKGAIECYDKVIELNPSHVFVLHDKGLALIGLGKAEEAIRIYNKTIEMDPSDAIAWNYKGLAFDSLGNYEEAIKCFDKASQIAPKYLDPGKNRRYVLDKIKKGKKKGWFR